MHERKVHIMNFSDKEKVDIKDFRESREIISSQEVGKKMIFPYNLRNLHDILRTEKDDLSVLKKIIRGYFL